MSGLELASATGSRAWRIEAEPLDANELLFWTIMRTFEVQATAQYRTYLPQLVAAKGDVASMLLGIAGDDRPLDESILGPTMRALVASTGAAHGEPALQVVQGLILERVRKVTYLHLMELPKVPAATKRIARVLQPISEEIVGLTPPLYRAWCAASGEHPFSVFVEASDDVLHKLDAVGEGVDEVFGDCFGLQFADIIGDFVADLVPVCVSLGMERRKVMSHLASALMGI